MQSNKMVVGRDEMDRLILMRMDVDRYENETIPALLQRAELLGQALLEYGCHKSSCSITQQSVTSCSCGLEAAIGQSRLQAEA